MERRLEIKRLTPEGESDFLRLTATEASGGCHCVAWWVDDWESWSGRTAEDNRCLRQELFARGEHDGYLAYLESEPVGWCQVGPRDRLAKLVRQFQLEPDPGAWAITCFSVPAEHRRSGVATALLDHVLADLPSRGASSLEAFPRHGDVTDVLELWNGPASLFARRGFVPVGRDERRLVLRCAIGRSTAD